MIAEHAGSQAAATPAAASTADEQRSAGPLNNLSSKAKSAALWNLGFNLFRDVLQFAQMLILARLLDEAAYGQFAFVTSVIGFLAVFSAAPFLSYTLQVKSEEEVHFQDHFTAAGVLNFAAFLIANLIALIVSNIPSYAAAAPLIHVLSVSFLLEWSCELRRKMIERAFDFRSLRLMHGVGLLLATATAITMALLDCGAYALVVPGMLVTVPFIWDLFIRQGWRPTWEFSWKNYRPAVQFGSNRIGSGLCIQGKTLVESTALIAVLGFGPLGILNRAIGLATLACTKLASQLMYAIYPILTRLDTNGGKAAQAGNLVIRLVVWSALPLAVLLACLAEPIVNTIYGETWVEVIPLMRWTPALALATAVTQVVYMLVLAQNKARLCLSTDVSVLIGTVICLLLALPLSVATYLVGLTAIQLIVAIGLTVWLVRANALTRRGLRSAFSPAFIAGLIAAGSATSLVWACGLDLRRFLPAAIWGVTFLATYMLALRVGFTSALEELVQFLPGRQQIARVLRLSVS